MFDDILPYYNSELRYMRGLAREFAAANPKVASQLRMSTDTIDDPHVLRLLEGLAQPREEDELNLSYYNSMTTWIQVDGLLQLFGVTRADLLQSDEARLARAVRSDSELLVRLLEKRVEIATLKYCYPRRPARSTPLRSWQGRFRARRPKERAHSTTSCRAPQLIGRMLPMYPGPPDYRPRSSCTAVSI